MPHEIMLDDWLSRTACRCRAREDLILELGEIQDRYLLLEPLADGVLARWHPKEGEGLEVDLHKARLFGREEVGEDVAAGAVAVSADEAACLAVEVDGALWIPRARLEAGSYLAEVWP